MAQKKKILLIDDDDNVLFTTKEILEIEGYEVVTHNSGFGTLSRIIQEKPDLILLDVNMPALSGDRLGKLLLEKEFSRQVPVLFYSSNDEDSLRRMVKDSGVHGYVCKGNVWTLRAKVMRVFKET